MTGSAGDWWSSGGHGVTLMSQLHWFQGVTRAWRDISALSEGKQL